MRIIIPLHELEYRYNASYYNPVCKYIDFNTIIELLFLDNTSYYSDYYLWEYIEEVDSSVCEDINLIDIIGMMLDVFRADFDRMTRSFIDIDIIQHCFVSMDNSILIVETNTRDLRVI